ncbi:hypothetical protein CXB51_029933 [Gossypium anomalum]|uniref:Uncharacterized protein n=1 Tax=Gossypium anomalum TaxID=47600 RepID=A0A8J5YL22_9ROSI|nr:hypothetical protein CXB51_029933 [Gossypium anomalum]
MSDPPSPLIENYLRAGVYHHFGGRAVIIEVTGGWVHNTYGGRIEIDWLRDTFSEPGDDPAEVERIRYAQAYIIEILGGYLMPDKSQNLVEPFDELGGISTALEDIWLLLDQRSEAHIQTSGMLGSHWSTTLLSRCTRQIECCDNSNFDNRFPWHLMCLMKSTKSTYGGRICIGRSSTRNISKCGKIGMKTYLLAN